MKFLNQLKNRIALSIGIGVLYALASGAWRDTFYFDIFAILTAAVLVYIPLTLIWAVFSTFFITVDKKPSDDVIDN